MHLVQSPLSLFPSHSLTHATAPAATALVAPPCSSNHTAMTSGCVPNTVRPNGNATKCIYNWWDDTMGHGTHTSGTIGAMRNGKGIIGVSAEGAQIYQ